MSSLALRTAVRASWALLMPGIPYFDTINMTLPEGDFDETPPPLWGTLIFLSVDRKPVTMGTRPHYEETGTVRIVLLAASGEGETAALSAASDAARDWHGWVAPGGQMWFSKIGAPQQLEPETRGDWFQVGVDCTYILQERATFPA